MTRSRPRFVRAGQALAGLAALALAVTWSPLMRSDGWPRPEAWTVALAGLSLVALSAVPGRRWRRPAGLLALALVGQSAALALVDAPGWSVFQHYRSWSELLSGPRGLLLLAPLVQSVVLGRWLRPRWPRIRRTVSGLLSPWQLAALLGALLVASAYARWDLAGYAGELLLASWVVAVNAGTLAMLAASVPDDVVRRTRAWIGRIAPTGEEAAHAAPASRWLVLGLAAWVVAASAFLAVVVFDRVPHVPDAVSYLFQAKYLSEGLLYLPAPPVPEAFDFEKLYVGGGKWWGYGFPGWPGVLAVGVVLGVPWAVNPILGGAALLLAHRLAREHYGERTALFAAALLACSPWFLFMSASFLSHNAALVVALLALLAAGRAVEGDSVRTGSALVGGLFFGALLLVRPLDAVVVGAGVGGWAVLTLRVRAWRFLLPTGAAAAAVGSLILPYNRALTGEPLGMPHEVWASERWYPGADRLGFGPDVGNLGWTHLDPLPGHGPFDVMINLHQNLFLSNFELFGWIFGSLLFVLLFLLWRRWNRSDRLFLAVALAVCLGYQVYWFGGGPDFGARYWYQALVPFVLLTVRGVREARRRLRASEAPPGERASSRLGVFVAGATLVALATFVPWRALGKYHDFRGMNADVERLADRHGIRGALVFVREAEDYDYPRAFILNPPTLASDGTIYARDLGPEVRRQVEAHFPSRPVWIIAGTGDPSTGFEIVRRPGERASGGDGRP